MGKRKVSFFSVLVFILGVSGLGLGIFSLYNYQQLVIQVETPKPLARAHLITGYTIEGMSYMRVNFDGEDYDITGDFNLLTGQFICPSSGYYYISGMVMFSGITDMEYILVGAYSEGAFVAGSIAQASRTGSLSAGFTDIVHLNEGDYIELRVYHSANLPITLYGDSQGKYTYFTIAATDILN